MTSAAKAASLFGNQPPKPTLTLRVGVSGHRPKPETLPAAHLEFVQKRLREVFAAIAAGLAKIARDPTWRTISAPCAVRCPIRSSASGWRPSSTASSPNFREC